MARMTLAVLQAKVKTNYWTPTVQKLAFSHTGMPQT